VQVLHVMGTITISGGRGKGNQARLPVGKTAGKVRHWMNTS
jgi:hypothetical protein